jgi:hypothetical protein
VRGARLKYYTQQKAQRESVITLSLGLLMLLLLLWLGGSSAVLAKSHIVCLSLQTQADQGMRVLVCFFFSWQHERLLFCLTTHEPNTLHMWWCSSYLEMGINVQQWPSPLLDQV